MLNNKELVFSCYIRNKNKHIRKWNLNELNDGFIQKYELIECYEQLLMNKQEPMSAGLLPFNVFFQLEHGTTHNTEPISGGNRS